MKSIHITQGRGRMSGTPCFVGRRVPVKSLFAYLEAGDSLETFLAQLPGGSRRTAIAVLEKSQQALLAAY